MDPTACVKSIFEAVDEGNWEDAAGRARNLRDWLKGGGSPPEYAKLGLAEQRRIWAIFALGIIAETEGY